MKKLINDPGDVVAQALLGMAAAHPELRVDHQHKIVYRAGGPVPGKVGVISGGGSGHEPMHGGFVGPGMLDAAIAGEVFTSPVPDQILAATTAVDSGAGVLQIVKNYTGDVMNFEMAAEMAAADSGRKVVAVVTDDDVAVQDSLYTAGRRGVGRAPRGCRRPSPSRRRAGRTSACPPTAPCSWSGPCPSSGHWRSPRGRCRRSPSAGASARRRRRRSSP